MPTPSDPIAKAISELAKVHDKRGGEIAEALSSIAVQIKYLGNGNASTQMGAIEALQVAVKEGLESLGSDLNSAITNLTDELSRDRA